MGSGQQEVFKIYQFLGKPLIYKHVNPITNSTFPAVLSWQPAAWLRVSGPDAATFLQGQFTNELRGLKAGGGAVYGLWLTVKGKVLADSFVLRGAGEEEFWVGSYFSSGAVIRERLESHVIADDVVVEDVTADWVGLSLVGSELAERAERGWQGGVVFSGRRTRRSNIEWVVPRAGAEAARAEFAGVAEVDAATAEAWRIAEAIPAVPVDIGPGDLPNEAGLEAEAISYTKGCYLGQEVMARLKSMGQVRRRLLRVRIDAAERPATPAALFNGPKQVGELRSLARDPAGDGFIGLAMLSLLHVTAEAKLAFAADASPCVSLLDAP